MRILVFDVGGTYTKYALVEDYEVRDRHRIRTPRENFMEELTSISKGFRGLDGIAVGFPGIVSEDGSVLFAPHLPSMVGRSIRRIVDIPVIIDNDANLFALGQYVLMRGDGVRNLVGITLGTGVGGGIVIDGRLYRGRGGAGEVGHIIIDVDGPRCDCGNYGCAEAFLGGAYFFRRCMTWFERKGIRVEELDGEKLREMADRGIEPAGECWEWYGRRLAVLVASLINIFAPDAVMLGGGLSGAFDHFSASMFGELERYLGERLRGVRVEEGIEKEISPFLGGFELFMV